ncbi:FCD domain-containing protein [Janibacter melonis]|uniref:FadR/GntR family transcriptional regulator n=1 Tax=Janibacter melonis TaxID=262209 RepID=UPI00336F74D1
MRRVSTPAPRRDLHVALLRDLGADLLGGVLGVGTALSTEQLEARYGVSRTVVREAVKVLESVGVLTARRRVGLVVRPPQEWDALSPLVVGWRLAGADRHRQLAEISELRRGVEPVAAALAARRDEAEHVARMRAAVEGMAATGPAGDLGAYLAHDVDFHTALLQASGNRALASMAGLVEQALAGRTEHDLMPAVPEPQAIRWHREIAEAIASGDAVRAEATMRLVVDEAADAMAQQDPAG